MINNAVNIINNTCNNINKKDINRVYIGNVYQQVTDKIYQENYHLKVKLTVHHLQ